MPRKTSEQQPPFTVYSHADPPARSHPESTTRFVLISDTHNNLPPLETIPDGDVLLHAGDLSRWGRIETLEATVRWLESLPHKTKIVIAGNHDSALDSSLHGLVQPHRPSELERARQLLQGPSAQKAGIHYLQHSSFAFKVRPGGRRWTVWGSPGSPDHGSPAFQYSDSEAPSLYAPIPARTDILLTHSPPYNPSTRLDLTSSGDHAGCPVLAREVERINPWMHVFGHIHEGRGVDVRAPSARPPGERWRVSVNAAMTRSHKSKQRYVHGGKRDGPNVKAERCPIVVDCREDLMEGWDRVEEADDEWTEEESERDKAAGEQETDDVVLSVRAMKL